MSDTSVLLALIGVVSAVVASVTTAMAWSQKKLVDVLEQQVIRGEEEKKLISQDNREQAATIAKLGVSVDKLTDQGAQTIRLLEDVVYGRQSTPGTTRRRTT